MCTELFTATPQYLAYILFCIVKIHRNSSFGLNSASKRLATTEPGLTACRDVPINVIDTSVS